MSRLRDGSGDDDDDDDGQVVMVIMLIMTMLIYDDCRNFVQRYSRGEISRPGQHGTIIREDGRIQEGDQHVSQTVD